MSCSLPFPEQVTGRTDGRGRWGSPSRRGQQGPARSIAASPAGALHTFPTKFYFAPLASPLPVPHPAPSWICLLRRLQDKAEMIISVRLLSCCFTISRVPRIHTGIEPRGIALPPSPSPASLSLPALRSVLCPCPSRAAGLLRCPSAPRNNPPGRGDAIPDPALVATAFTLSTDTELNLFSRFRLTFLSIFDKGHAELPCFFFQ